MAWLPIIITCIGYLLNNSDSKITNNLYFQKIGLWSYSIYLWHWPVVVFIRNFIDDITLLVLFSGMSLSVLLGFLSYTLIEKTQYKIIKYSIFIITILASTYIFQTNGVKSPLREISQSPVNDFVLKYKSYNNNNAQFPDYSAQCAVSRYGQKYGKFGVADFCLNEEKLGGVFLWGDSHMGALGRGIRYLLPESTVINQVTSSGCPSSFSIKQGNISRLRRACDYANSLVFKAITKISPEVVIIANKDNHQVMDWGNTVRTLKELGVKQIILVGPVPQWYPSLPLVYANKAFGQDTLASHKIDRNVIKTNIEMNKISLTIPDLIYVDVLSQLCKKDGNIYSCKVIYDDVLLVWDYGHLTKEGARHVASEYVLPAFEETIK